MRFACQSSMRGRRAARCMLVHALDLIMWRGLRPVAIGVFCDVDTAAGLHTRVLSAVLALSTAEWL